MSLQAYYDAFRQGHWATEKGCLCRGSGWALSDLDTWHECPLHYEGQPHPDADAEEHLAYELKKAGWTAPVVLDAESERFGYNASTGAWDLRAGFPVYGDYDLAACEAAGAREAAKAREAAACEEDLPF